VEEKPNAIARPRRPATRPLFACVMAAMAALVCGCSGNPTQTAANYLNNLRLYNYPACYGTLSHQDRLERTMENFLVEPPLAPVVSRAWFKAVLRAVNYKITGVRRLSRVKAAVTVRVTRPDLPLWERTIDAAVGPSGDPVQAARRALDDGNYPKLRYDDDIVVIKEKGGWHILVDFPAKDEIEKKHRDGIDAYHKHDYERAIGDYQAALADLAREEATGNAGLEFIYQRELDEIERVMNQIPRARAYVPKLVLSHVDMKMSASRVPAIFGKIKNSGSKAIDDVVCTVTYYAGAGRRRKALYTEEHTIIATPLEFVNFSRPVLPFVPGETRSFGFRLNAPVNIQQSAAPVLQVTGIAFTQSPAPLPKPAPEPESHGAAPKAHPSPSPAPPRGKR
jgi:hypothetical protein